MKINIIGAGPSGCYSAYVLSKYGYDVKVYEEHSKIGLPFQCTGLVTSAIRKFVKENSYVVNKIKEARIFSPNGNCCQIKLSKPNFVLDRVSFDRYLAENAVSEGAKIILKSKFKELSIQKGKVISIIGNRKIESDVVVGADGPNSKVAMSSGLYGKRKFVIGHQVRLKKKNDNIIEFWLGIGKFAWIVPESENIIRAGVVADRMPKSYLRNFLKIKGLERKKPIDTQSGLIPVYNPKIKTEKNGVVYIIGDAATMVKPVTFGGIIQGLMAAEELGKAIKEGKSFEKLWRRRFGKDLYYGLVVRRILDKFGEKEYNELIEIIKGKRIRKLLGKKERDFFSSLLFRALLIEPRFLKFIKIIIR